MDESKLIYKKIGAIMRKIEPIAKGQRNKHQGWSYRGIDDIYNSLQPIMAEEGVFTTTEVIHSEHHDRESTNSKGEDTLAFHTFLKVKIYLWCEDGSSVSSTIEGEAMDYSDKSSNKALSAALKYMLMQMFLIPTAEAKDPDGDSPEIKPPQKRQKTPQNRQNGEALLEEMKTEGLAACKTIKQVESVARKWSERFGDSTDEIFQQGLDAIEERKKELNAAAAGMMEGMEDGSDKT